MAGLNFFDKMFDFNHDGNIGAFETGAKWATIAHIMDDGSKSNDSLYGVSSSGSYDSGLDDIQRLDLELAGLDSDDLEYMDEDERREVLEEAGLDPDDYDDF